MENNFNYEQEIKQPMYEQPVRPQKTEETSVMTTGQWFLTTFLISLPLVGFILTIVWALGNGNVNRKNFCRACLIWSLISLVLSLLLCLVMWAAMAGMMFAIEEYMYYPYYMY